MLGRKKKSHLCRFHWIFLQFLLFPLFQWCLLENGTYLDLAPEWVSRLGQHRMKMPLQFALAWSPLHLSLSQGRLSWKGCIPASTAPADPSHPKAAILEKSRGWSDWLGSPSVSPCWRKPRSAAQALASALWESPHEAAKPSAAGICIFWPQTRK